MIRSLIITLTFLTVIFSMNIIIISDNRQMINLEYEGRLKNRIEK